MKRILSLVLLMFVLALSFSSCHGAKKRDAFIIPDEFDTSKNYEISFWAKNDTNLTQVNIYKKAIEDFEAIYPNIKVNLRLYTDYGRIYQDVLTNIATGTTPNVCITYPDHIATYMTGENNVVPLTDLFVDEKFGLAGSEVKFEAPTKEEIIPKFLEECKLGTDYYAVPYMRSTEACYVNKTYVEKLGYTLPDVLTWDFVWEVSEAAMAKDADGNFLVNGQKTMIPFIYKSTDNMMISMLRQLDEPYSTSRGEILLFNDTTKSLLLEIAEHTETKAFCTFKIIGYPANFLNAGQCIFAIDSTGGATWMGSDAPLVDIPEENMVDFETAVMTIPQFDAENPKMISQGPSMCIFNKEDPQEVLASWLFMQFMLTNEVQISYSQTEGYIPVTSKAQESPEYKDYLSREGEDNDFYYDIKIKAAKLMIDNIENSFTTAVFNGSTSLRDAAGQLIENVTKSVRRHQNVDEEYIETLYEDMTSLYHLDNTELSAGTVSSLSPLPLESKLLISALCTVWVFILVYLAVSTIKKRKNT
ncbi:MAG: extracellular solute-binding protein [Clostridia bacterium]|nr:extracellular solute-binding protein [Clostridia bacterium]